MATIPNGIYAPPGVYTQTNFTPPNQGAGAAARIPLILGPGSESLTQTALEIVRGSSSSVDQRVVQEDEAGRAVVMISPSGRISIGPFDGVYDRIQVRNFPIVTGNGTGTTATDTASVAVTVDGQPVVVLSIDGARGILRLSVKPLVTDDVRVTYYFNRTDTLITDSLGDQTSAGAANIYGSTGQNFVVITGVNDNLLLTLDDATALSVVIGSSPVAGWTAAQIAAFVNGVATGTTLVASTAVNNFGATVISLTAARNILIGNGSANGLLGLTSGAYTGRNKTFYVFQQPIVDGSNGGVTTTDPADVTVKVDGVQVIPAAVDGQSGAITLPFAPQDGATVTAQYHFNSWQDTFDYLANRSVSEVSLCGITPDRDDYIENVDFVLQDDMILWGTAVTVDIGEHTAGSVFLGASQVLPTLVDVREYLAPCDAYVNTAVNPAVEDRKQFVLPLTPTTGNGRNSPIGTTTFNQVANGRVDLPTNRPDLVFAYWGFSIQDAIDRGRATVTKVDSATATITLADPVPVGANVYATFYYNTVQDIEYTISVETAGTSGVGTYSIANQDGGALFVPSFGTKSAGLATVQIQFPSGSERLPDARFETPYDATSFIGPVAEDVTIEFARRAATPAKYAVPSSGPYYPVFGSSDVLNVAFDGDSISVNLSNPTGAGCGFSAQIVGNEIAYSAASGGASFVLDATNNSIDLLVDGVLIQAVAIDDPASTAANYATAINTAAALVAPVIKSKTQFVSPITIELNGYDLLVLHYTGDVSGPSGEISAIIPPGTYATAATLAVAISAAIAPQLPGDLGVTVTADASSRLNFALGLLGGDASGYLEFITGDADHSFWLIAGISSAAATGGAQTKLIQGPIARVETIGVAPLLYDRIILRNRIVPGSGTIDGQSDLAQCGLQIIGGSGSAQAGLTAQEFGYAGLRATIMEATLAGNVSLLDQDPTGQPLLTFHAAGGLIAQNNVFKITLDGTPITMTFTDGAGAAIPVGESAEVSFGPLSLANTVLAQINAALVASASSGTVIQEGAGLRFRCGTAASSDLVLIGNGSANSILGFATGATASRSDLTPEVLVSGLLAQSKADVADYLLFFAGGDPDLFAGPALAKTVVNQAGAKYLYLQSKTLGTASSIAFEAGTALRPGVGLGVVVGDGNVGEAAMDGFFVISSDLSDGSGSVNSSILNDGTGQDGQVGQTYRDAVTGLTFTILARPGGADYPIGQTFTIKARAVGTCDSNIPNYAVPGVQLIVANTTGVGIGDSALVTTHNRSGAQPAVGDVYYVTYNYSKQDYSALLFTRLSSIEAAYGPNTPTNPVTLASYLAFLNGTVLLAIKQVVKDQDSNSDGTNDSCSTAAYITAIDDVEGALPGGAYPDILVPLKGDDPTLFGYLAKHCDVQSSIRYRAERTAICGFSAGTQPRDAGNIAAGIARSRMRMVYPDIATLTLSRADGSNDSYLVDGTFLASAVAATRVAPSIDVATPWTGTRLFGFDRLARMLDAVQQNQIAVRGVTILEDKTPVIRVRQGFTTDMSNVMTKTPTVIQIADEVQKQCRAVLDRFTGVKFLPGVTSQIEGQLSAVLRSMVEAQIISSYTGVSARVSPSDPTTCEVSAAYTPIFPLLYIVVTFQVSALPGS